MEAHLLAPLIERQSDALALPFVALLVSGGHTQLVHVRAFGDYDILGESVDDAAGEAFDKTAKAFGLGLSGRAKKLLRKPNKATRQDFASRAL